MAIIGALMTAVYISTSVLLSEGNQLAGLFFWVTIACGVMGVVAPRFSFSMLILQCAYLDLFKRLLVMAGKVRFDELFYVLGIAPVTVVGIACGLLLRAVNDKNPVDIGHIKRLALAVALNAILAIAMYLKGGGIGGTLKEVANGSSYTLLLFIVPLLFRTPEEIGKCVKFVILTFVPVALYVIYQQMYGFQEFEIEYLKTNLSIESKQLTTFADRIRAFGTLNSPTSVSVVVNSIAAMALALMRTGRMNHKIGMPGIAAVMIILLGMGAWAASTVRVGLLLFPVAVVGTFLFLRPATAKWFYGMAITAFGFLVFFSSYLFDNFEEWTRHLMELIGASGYVENMINMNTYKDRLSGFANVLMNPAAYSLFGLPAGATDEGVVHDPLSVALVSYGVVPLGILIIAVASATWRMHKVIFVMRNPALKLLAAAFLANAAGNLAVTIVNGNLLNSFPVNVFFWLPLGWAIALVRADAAAEETAVQAPPTPHPQMRPAMAPLPQRIPGAKRFRPVPSNSL